MGNSYNPKLSKGYVGERSQATLEEMLKKAASQRAKTAITNIDAYNPTVEAMVRDLSGRDIAALRSELNDLVYHTWEPLIDAAKEAVRQMDRALGSAE